LCTKYVFPTHAPSAVHEWATRALVAGCCGSLHCVRKVPRTRVEMTDLVVGKPNAKPRMGFCLGGFEEEAGFAENLFGAAGFAEEFERAVVEGGVVVDFGSVAGVGRKHEDLAVGLLGVELVG
jgi:hypothetical protein